MANNSQKEIEITIRLIIQDRGKFLLCKDKYKDYYFLPGGHVEFGESVKQALAREIKEELGLPVQKHKFIGAVENLYIENNRKRHEISLVFEVKVKNLKARSKENHIDFFLKNKKELTKEKILPIALTKSVLRWLKDKKLFWASQI